MKKLSTLIVLFSLWISPLFAQQKILESAILQAESNGFSGIVLVSEDGKVLLEWAIGYRSFENKTQLKETDIF